MKNHYQILIVGAGNAGLALASQLLIKDKSLEIGIIDPSEHHYYQPAWTLVGAGEFDINATKKAQKDFIPKGTTWIKDAVSSFQPNDNQLTCKSGNNYTYGILVVAPGIQIDWNKIKGLTETLGKNNVTCNYSFDYAPYTWELIKNFKGGTAVFTNPATPIKCGGAPHKIMYLACDYWKKKGILDKCDVHYVSGASMLFGVKEYAATLNKKIAEYGITTHFGANVKSIDGNSKTIFFETKENTADISKQMSKVHAGCYAIHDSTDGDIKEISLKFDFCHVVPPQSAPDFIKNSPLADPNNPHGYVDVNKNTFQHTRYANIFSLGDASNAPCSKTGAAIRKQTPVVVAHILAKLKNTTSDASYNGYSACPIPTQYGKLMLAEFDYTNTPTMTFPFDQAKPRWTMWLLKKYILPWLYWNKILSGKA
ncbi:MAG: NAD(P)/FAD-dependent oxidoreductase [Saprospiraceae bacterium]|nr:NAD(P)/FAD-dependent oxidoreductase [Saprospiraceae bacterium]